MSKDTYKTCWECGKELERCRIASIRPNGDIEWVCRRCWKELRYDDHMYEHRKGINDA